MKYATPERRQAARRLLEREVDDTRATPEHLAAAAGRLLTRLSTHLAQVIGGVGMDALWLRAVKLQLPSFPFLEACVMSQEGTTPGTLLSACLHDQEPEIIREAVVMLFATVGGLLATLIGDTLARSLMQEVWPETPRREAKETGE